MHEKKEDSKARERNLEEQLAAESSANQELQVRFASRFSLHSMSNVVQRCLYSYRQRVRVITVVKMLWPSESTTSLIGDTKCK